MSKYDVKKIDVFPVIKIFSVVFAIVGALIGIFTFFIFPTDLAAGLGFGARLLSWFIFVLLYTFIMSVGALVVAFLYNFVAAKLGSGIVISLEAKE
ncbi:MAG: hypothetical protein LBR69_05455 [Endomicrobium sp.]|jgi:hypothetical protein|nr:hypothetical protein [Endomicrobium sp.]